MTCPDHPQYRGRYKSSHPDCETCKEMFRLNKRSSDGRQAGTIVGGSDFVAISEGITLADYRRQMEGRTRPLTQDAIKPLWKVTDELLTA